jgi:hypothetical protein
MIREEEALECRMDGPRRVREGENRLMVVRGWINMRICKYGATRASLVET